MSSAGTGWIGSSLRGGVGAVFAATHVRIDRRVAIKVLAPDFVRRTAYFRFVEAARIVNRVRHPNVVEVFDIHESADPPLVALVMELLRLRVLSTCPPSQSSAGARQITRQKRASIKTSHCSPSAEWAMVKVYESSPVHW